MPTELRGFLSELGMAQYVDIFVQNGFDKQDTILDIQESDVCEPHISFSDASMVANANA